MADRIWVKDVIGITKNEIILDSTGRIILCDECPCEIVVPVNNPPIIYSYIWEEYTAQQFRIAGVVVDETPAMCAVIVSGAASGTMLCDSLGNFVGVFNVPTLGAFSLTPNDGTQDGSVINDTFINVAPTLPTFIITAGGGVKTLSGTATDDCADAGPSGAAGLQVTFSGHASVNGHAANVLSDGSWSHAVLGLPTGTVVTATITDWYGLTAVRTATAP